MDMKKVIYPTLARRFAMDIKLEDIHDYAYELAPEPMVHGDAYDPAPEPMVPDLLYTCQKVLTGYQATNSALNLPSGFAAEAFPSKRKKCNLVDESGERYPCRLR